MKRMSLFREEALLAPRAQWLGEIIMIRPPIFSVLATISSGFALMIAAMLFLGSYTKRSTVSGQLISDIGVIKVYPPQAGIVLKKAVEEGQHIHQGDILYTISSERQTAARSEIQKAISTQVASRRQSLLDELAHTKQAQQDEQSAQFKKIEALQAEQNNVMHQLASQRNRIELSEDAYNRATQLFEQGFISREVMQQKQADLLDQRLRLQTLERDEINVGRELLAARNDAESLPLRQHNQLAQIERLLANTEQEWTESESKRSIAVTAPESGIVTAITAEAGQTVDGAKPVISIIPTGAQLQAHLFAPSRAIGFIHQGDTVLLRCQAFPFQKFGHVHGVILSISQTSLPPGELGASSTGEPLYRITVKLAHQTLTAYGKPQPLQLGMQVEADVLLERRRLYEWVLEPLYSLTGKL